MVGSVVISESTLRQSVSIDQALFSGLAFLPSFWLVLLTLLVRRVVVLRVLEVETPPVVRGSSVTGVSAGMCGLVAERLSGVVVKRKPCPKDSSSSSG